MGWPKGKPRKGHIKKDGQMALAPGRKVRSSREAMSILMSKIGSSGTGTEANRPRTRVGAAHTSSTARSSLSQKRSPKTVPSETLDQPYKVWGIKNNPVIEPCPNCGYGYAEAGYCGECGWTKFDPDCRHCQKVFDKTG